MVELEVEGINGRDIAEEERQCLKIRETEDSEASTDDQ